MCCILKTGEEGKSLGTVGYLQSWDSLLVFHYGLSFSRSRFPFHCLRYPCCFSLCSLISLFTSHSTLHSPHCKLHTAALHCSDWCTACSPGVNMAIIMQKCLKEPVPSPSMSSYTGHTLQVAIQPCFCIFNLFILLSPVWPCTWYWNVLWQLEQLDSCDTVLTWTAWVAGN